jgi:hypothetical protein
MPKGGARPGAGKPKGYKHQGTLEKEEARKLLRARVFAQLAPMIDAQIENAKGLKYLVVRDKKTGKFLRVTEAMAKEKQQQSDREEVIEVWEKDPAIHAFDALVSQAIGKAPQHIELTGADGGPVRVYTWKNS